MTNVLTFSNELLEYWLILFLLNRWYVYLYQLENGTKNGQKWRNEGTQWKQVVEKTFIESIFKE